MSAGDAATIAPSVSEIPSKDKSRSPSTQPVPPPPPSIPPPPPPSSPPILSQSQVQSLSIPTPPQISPTVPSALESMSVNLSPQITQFGISNMKNKKLSKSKHSLTPAIHPLPSSFSISNLSPPLSDSTLHSRSSLILSKLGGLVTIDSPSSLNFDRDKLVECHKSLSVRITDWENGALNPTYFEEIINHLESTVVAMEGMIYTLMFLN